MPDEDKDEARLKHLTVEKRNIELQIAGSGLSKIHPQRVALAKKLAGIYAESTALKAVVKKRRIEKWEEENRYRIAQRKGTAVESLVVAFNQAIDYVKAIEKENSELRAEVAELRARLEDKDKEPIEF